MGIADDTSMGFVYSISEDGKFKVTEVHSHTVVTELTPGKSGLKYMIYSPLRSVFIIADGDGFIYIYSANIVNKITPSHHYKLLKLFYLASSRTTQQHLKYFQKLHKGALH